MRALRKTLKYLLPFGLIEMARNRRILRAHGREMSLRDCWRSDWLMHEADASGLGLFPPGHWRGLRTVVDVGANLGQWAGMALDLIVPEKLIVIEPQPRAFAELQRRFAGVAGLELHCVAIGDVNGMTKFRLTRDSTGASVLSPREEMRALVGSNWTVESEIEVPLRTLDSLLVGVPEISLLKIDVQGFEKAVLAGAAETLTRTSFLLIELNYQRQYIDGSWFGELHELLTQEHPFVLVNTSKPLRLNGRASMSDGLYVNIERLPDFAPRDFA